MGRDSYELFFFLWVVFQGEDLPLLSPSGRGVGLGRFGERGWGEEHGRERVRGIPLRVLLVESRMTV